MGGDFWEGDEPKSSVKSRGGKKRPGPDKDFYYSDDDSMALTKQCKVSAGPKKADAKVSPSASTKK
jgi:hypothetical protein